MENALPRSRGLALIVDDVADNRDLYSVALSISGFHVQTAEHAEEGIAMAFAERPAVIVMDHSLPGLDGCEAIKVLKQDPRTASVPIIMVTGHGADVEKLARTCGADDFRTKPLKPSDLIAALDALLGGVRARAQ